MHAPKLCKGEYCPFHNPSDHHMKDWPIVVRYDRYGLAERLCAHGTGHPDPDSVAWLKRLYDKGTLFNLGILDPPYPEDLENPDYNPYSAFTVHGCCLELCCLTDSEKKHLEKTREYYETHDLSAEMENGHYEND